MDGLKYYVPAAEGIAAEPRAIDFPLLTGPALKSAYKPPL